MTADELMRLVSRYVEACDDLGDGLFEKPLTTTDDLHAKATGLHKQILDEVYRLHADVAQARQTAEYWKAEHLAGNARIGELHEELAETALRSAAHPPRAPLTEEQKRDLVKECDLDWQRGFMPLFDGDPTNRYAVLIEAVEAAHGIGGK